jgi:hypothetical protein
MRDLFAFGDFLFLEAFVDFFLQAFGDFLFFRFGEHAGLQYLAH